MANENLHCEHKQYLSKTLLNKGMCQIKCLKPGCGWKSEIFDRHKCLEIKDIKEVKEIWG
jgi:hypothetical protein